MPKRLGSRGDTIVEVLIAIAVVSAVLGGAFASAQRSLNGTIISRERGEAVKFVEGQLESLKAILGSDDVARIDTAFSSTGGFCISDTLTIVTDLNNVACRKGIGERYRVSIIPTGNLGGGTGREFTAAAVWDRSGGGSQEQVQIEYRAYR